MNVIRQQEQYSTYILTVLEGGREGGGGRERQTYVSVCTRLGASSFLRDI